MLKAGTLYWSMTLPYGRGSDRLTCACVAVWSLVFSLSAHAAPDFGWATQIASPNYQAAGIAAVSPRGNVYVTTAGGGTNVRFGTNAPITADANYYIAKYATSGQLLWVGPAKGVASPSLSCVFDAAENMYVTAMVRFNVQFGPLSRMSTNSTSKLLLAKIEPNGNIPWAKLVCDTDEEFSPVL